MGSQRKLVHCSPNGRANRGRPLWEGMQSGGPTPANKVRSLGLVPGLRFYNLKELVL